MKFNNFSNDGLNDASYLKVFDAPELEKLEKGFVELFNRMNKKSNVMLSKKYINILDKIKRFADLEEIETFETAYGIFIK